jgi:hypothetical protein
MEPISIDGIEEAFSFNFCPMCGKELTLSPEKIQGLYLDTFNKSFSAKKLSTGWIEIETPYIDRRNDAIVIYVREEKKNEITISDDGYYSEDPSFWKKLTEEQRMAMENHIAMFGVTIENHELVKKTTMEELPFAMHMFLDVLKKLENIEETFDILHNNTGD